MQPFPQRRSIYGVIFAPNIVASVFERLQIQGMAKTISKKVGRPKKGVQSVRFSPRFPKGVAETLRRACALRGVSVSSFVVSSAQKAAERVIEEETRWRLDADETSRLASLLARPPKLNSASRKAQALAADVEIRS